MHFVKTYWRIAAYVWLLLHIIAIALVAIFGWLPKSEMAAAVSILSSFVMAIMAAVSDDWGDE